MRRKDRQIALLSRLNGALASPSSIIEVPVWKKRLLRLGCLYPPRVFVPARRRAMEKTNFPCGERMAREVVGRGAGGSGWREKNKKKERKKYKKEEKKRRTGGKEKGWEKKGRENNVRFPRLSDRAWQREQTYPNLTL